MNNKIIIELNAEEYELQDVILCAFRYAIYRKTYVVAEICEFIKNNSHLLNHRMINVMKRDLDKCFNFYENSPDTSPYSNYESDIDYNTLKIFEHWLLVFETTIN